MKNMTAVISVYMYHADSICFGAFFYPEFWWRLKR